MTAGVNIHEAKKKGGVTGRGSMKGETLIASDKEMKKVDEEIADLLEENELFPGENPRRGRA
jgi:hypothetical protein